jgi:hypothetical protein
MRNFRGRKEKSTKHRSSEDVEQPEGRMRLRMMMGTGIPLPDHCGKLGFRSRIADAYDIFLHNKNSDLASS